jgi:hypothetical protein
MKVKMDPADILDGFKCGDFAFNKVIVEKEKHLTIYDTTYPEDQITISPKELICLCCGILDYLWEKAEYDFSDEK